MIAVSMPGSPVGQSPQSSPQSQAHCLVFMRHAFGDKPADQLERANDWCVKQLGAQELVATRIYFHAHFSSPESAKAAMNQSVTNKAMYRPAGSVCLQRNCGQERHSVSGRVKRAGLDHSSVRRWILAQKRVVLVNEVFRDTTNQSINQSLSPSSEIVSPVIPQSIKAAIDEKQRELGFAALPPSEQHLPEHFTPDVPTHSRSPSVTKSPTISNRTTPSHSLSVPLPYNPHQLSTPPTNQSINHPSPPSSPPQSKRTGLKVYVKSRQGSSWDVNKTNQDRPLACVPLRGHPGVNIYGVLDGHGQHGHFVSEYVMHQLPAYLSAQQTTVRENPHAAILSAMRATCSDLSRASNINLAFSGTTCLFGMHIGDELHVANIGDSRAVIGRRSSDSKTWTAVPLSRDHKPDTPGEKERILAAGGRVAPIPGLDSGGPNRVWLADLDEPGLAMSRSIGDTVSATVGVIDVPEIQTYQLQPNDTFALFASDGIWEFISNDEAVAMVVRHLDNPAVSVNALVAEAVKRWQEDSDQVIDDITVVLVVFAQRGEV